MAKAINLKKIIESKRNLENCKRDLKYADSMKDRWPEDAQRAMAALAAAEADFAAVSGPVSAVLDDVQKRSKTRTVTVDDICHAVERIEETLDIPKSRLDGISAEIDIHAQKYPSAYKYIPESTQFDLENRRGVWYLSNVRRDTTGKRSKSIILTALPQDAIDAIVSRCMAF